MYSECRRGTQREHMVHDGAAARRVRAVLLGALMIAALPSAGAQGPASDAVAQIRALELAQNVAIAHGDAAAMAKVTSADFAFITPRGFLLSRAQMLQGLSDGQFAYEYRQISDLNIRLYGDTAVVTGQSLHTVQQGGREWSEGYRYSRVYVRQHGAWLVVLWHATSEY
jgi:ketosteroid isomerase-like protein